MKGSSFEKNNWVEQTGAEDENLVKKNLVGKYPGGKQTGEVTGVGRSYTLLVDHYGHIGFV